MLITSLFLDSTTDVDESEQQGGKHRITRSEMIQATQTDLPRRDDSPQASRKELRDAEDATTKHDAKNSKVMKGSSKASKSGMSSN